MGAARPLAVTGPSELHLQLDHPSAAIIRSRAAEVFGNAARARAWLNRPRTIFNSQSPRQMIQSGDIEKMRTVLKALIAIEFGTFS